MNPFPLALANVRARPVTSLILALLVAAALALGVVVEAQERAVRRGSARAADGVDLLIGAPGSATQAVLAGIYLQPAALPLLPDDMLAKVEATPGITWFAPLAFGDHVSGAPIIGTSQHFISRLSENPLSEGRLFAADHEAVIGADVALQLGDELTPSHGLPLTTLAAVTHDHNRLRIVGRAKRTGSPYDRAVLVAIESVWQTHALPSGREQDDERIGGPWRGRIVAGVPLIAIKVNAVADAYRLRARFRAIGLLSVFPAEVLAELYATLGDIRRVLSAMALASSALVLIALMIALITILDTRRRQIAMLRALGASRCFVVLALWSEMALVLLSGGALGWALAAGLSAMASSLLAPQLGFALPSGLQWSDLHQGAITLACALLLAIIPALMAVMRPIGPNLKG